MTELSELVETLKYISGNDPGKLLSTERAALSQAAAILARLDVEELKAAIFEATGTMGMPKPLALDWAGGLAQAILTHVTGERS